MISNQSNPVPVPVVVQSIAPKKSFCTNPTIEGYLVLEFFGHSVTMIGGSFDAYRKGAIGVCLEAQSSKAKDAQFLFPIPDFQAPDQFATERLLANIVRLAIEAPGLPVYVGCRAGRGRTGTIMAGLVKVSDAVPEDPVEYVRSTYCRAAVETHAQALLVIKLDAERVRASIEKSIKKAEVPVVLPKKQRAWWQKLLRL